MVNFLGEKAGKRDWHRRGTFVRGSVMWLASLALSVSASSSFSSSIKDRALRLIEAVELRWNVAGGKDGVPVSLSSPESRDSRSSKRLFRERFMRADHQEGREFAAVEAEATAPADVDAAAVLMAVMSTTNAAGTAAVALDLDEKAEHSCRGRFLGGSFESEDEEESWEIFAFCKLMVS